MAQPDAGEGLLDVGQHRPGDVHRRRADQVRHAVTAHLLERVDRVEALDQQAGRAVPGHRAEGAVEAVDVEQREHQQHDVVGGGHRRVDPRALVEVGQQRPVRQHRALRAAAGARRVEHDREVLAAADGLDRRRPALLAGLLQVGRGQQDVLQAGGRLAQLGHVAGRAPVGEEGAGAAVLQDVQQLGAGVAGVDRHDDHPGAQGAEVGDREVQGVAQLQGEPVAGLHAEPLQTACDAVDARVELAPRQGLRPRQEGRLVGGACRPPGAPGPPGCAARSGLSSRLASPVRSRDLARDGEVSHNRDRSARRRARRGWPGSPRPQAPARPPAAAGGSGAAPATARAPATGAGRRPAPRAPATPPCGSARRRPSGRPSVGGGSSWARSSRRGGGPGWRRRRSRTTGRRWVTGPCRPSARPGRPGSPAAPRRSG